MIAYFRPYLALFRVRFRVLLQYRQAAVAGIATQVFWGLIKIIVLQAFYKGSVAPQPLTFADTVTYTWLGQAFLVMLPFTVNPDPEVRNLIRTGAVAYELARPIDLYSFWYTRQVTSRSAPTLLRCVPIFLLAIPFLGMATPPTIGAALGFVATLFGALFLSAAFMTLITVSLLWTVSGDGIARLAPSLALIGSGLIIPLPLFPDGMQPFLNLLPFRGMADAPFRLYMGHLPPEATPGILGHQAIWIFILVVLGRMLLARGTRILTIQGG